MGRHNGPIQAVYMYAPLAESADSGYSSELKFHEPANDPTL